MDRRTVLAVLLSTSCASHAGSTVADTGVKTGAQQRFSYQGREVIVYAPRAAARALVVVLHGGLGNADRIAGSRNERPLNLDAAAEKHRFVVAYLNGTQVARIFSEDKKGWNAGTCCGLPAATGVDDVSYITATVAYLVKRHGLDANAVFITGHSNGAMMAMRMMCQTDVFAAAVPFSGAIGVDAASCGHAKGKKVRAFIGAQDENVPLAGGRGKGLSRAVFTSQEATTSLFVGAGADYELRVVKGADHSLQSIDDALIAQDRQGVAEKVVEAFGLK